VFDQYEILRSRSTAAEFHQRRVVEPARPEIWLHEVTRPALVIGSTQSEDVVDNQACRRGGVDVVRRRSGGGAVLLVPGEVTWIDVILPAGAPGWSSDVHAPMVWLGRLLGEAVEAGLSGSEPPSRLDVQAPDVRIQDVQVHEGKMLTTTWSSLVCFDGVGSGEVLLDGEKLIGISQRRTRFAARLQCCWYSDYEPSALTSLLDAGVRPPVAELLPVATIARSVATAIPEALLDRLNDLR
jgi:lipoate-protein ligase A